MPADFILGAAIGAAAASTNVRKAVRRGLVYGVGGVLVAYDKLAAGAHAFGQSVRQAAVASKGSSAAHTNGTAETNGTPAPAPSANPSADPVAASPAAGTPS
jgi:hypothetical protein